MESCRSCGEKIEATANFCPACGRSTSEDLVTVHLTGKILRRMKIYSLVAIAAGLCMIPFIMSSEGLSVIFPILSSCLIMGGVIVYVWARFGTWWLSPRP